MYILHIRLNYGNEITAEFKQNSLSLIFSKYPDI